MGASFSKYTSILPVKLKDGKLAVKDFDGKVYHCQVKTLSEFKESKEPLGDFTNLMCRMTNQYYVFVARLDGTYSLVRRRDGLLMDVGTFDLKAFPRLNDEWKKIGFSVIGGKVRTLLLDTTTQDRVIAVHPASYRFRSYYKLKKPFTHEVDVDKSYAVAVKRLAPKYIDDIIIITQSGNIVNWRCYLDEVSSII